MKKRSIICLLLVIVFIMSFTLTAFYGCDENMDPNGSIQNPDGNKDPNDTDQNPDDKKDDPSIEDENYTLDLEEGKNQVIFYWTKSNLNIQTSDIWIWWDGKEGSGNLMHKCAYGAKVIVNVPEEVTQVGFIVRTGCSDPGGSSWGNATKDYDSDRFAIITGKVTEIYLKSGDANQYTSTDGGITLNQIKSFTTANLVSLTKVKYVVSPSTRITSLDQIKLYEGDKEIRIASLSSLNNKVTTGTITLETELDIAKEYTLSIEGYGEKKVMPIDYFSSNEFNDKYGYDGWLGNKIEGDSTEFRVWAPTASKVKLNLFETGDGGKAYKVLDMELGEKGVWSIVVPKVGHGVYYTYSVTTSVGEQEAVDPYAKSAGVNGNRGMVLDLSLTNPTGWGNVDYIDSVKRYTDAVIWEIHVRDFSNKISASNYKGKYLAFTETGLKNSHGISVGVDYIKDLGITHIQLMPAYDYATVDESNPESGFNWGYDPKNYNVPEGSYSTNPYDGTIRVNEFKQMVQALHNQGIGVIMDVVYNHTYDANSSLNKIVPYYYYRYTSAGVNTSASGCGNDTASERYMYRRYMIDSVTYWAQEYKIDGFRFDLMGLHDLTTMEEIEKALHAINPNAIIYGEGWTMGSTTDGSLQANQTNISFIESSEGASGGVGVFNDVIRDGLKGSVFESSSQGYINGDPTKNINAIKFAMNGGTSGAGWSVKDAGIINYMSCHDNLSLWDKLAIANPDDSIEDRVKMNKLGVAIIMASRGTPLMQAGEEMLRSKQGDENSYKSSDEINNIDWELLSPDSIQYLTSRYYKGLIEMRKSVGLFTSMEKTNCVFNVDRSSGFMDITITGGDNSALVILNPSMEAVSFTVRGEWNLLVDGNNAGSESLRKVSGEISVPALTALILVG